MLNSKKVQLGCGKRAFPDFCNVDIAPEKGVDVIHDLDVYPYPFADGQFEYIHAEDVIEHLTSTTDFIAECWRILSVGGRLWIRTNDADFSGKAWRDPTHKHAYEFETFDYWCKGTYYGDNYGSFYPCIKPFPFKLVEKRKHNFGIEVLLEKCER